MSTDDGLPASEFGGVWTAHKLFFLCNYLEQTTRGMSGNPSFPNGLNYVDLFAGSGVCSVEMSPGRWQRYPGSPLIAACTPKPFNRLFLVDRNTESISALKTRISKTSFKGALNFWEGDANAVIDEVRAAIPVGSLTVAFIDPYSLDIHYESLKRLADSRPLDLILLLSDALDIVRNVETYYLPGKSDKLDRFLGLTSGWRSHWNNLSNRDASSVRQLFAELFLRQLQQLGYRHSKSWPLEGPNGPVFRLVYASKNERGLQFCEIARNLDFEGNRGLFGGM